MDETALSEASAESTHPPDDWSAHDIEEAYQKALRAIEEISGEPAPDATAEPAGAELPETAVAADISGEQSPAEPGAPPAVATNNPRSAEKSQSLRIAEGTSADAGFERTHVTPKQVIEAALFVGGGPITARKLAALLRGSFQPDVVEQMIDELNQEYAEQARPYEIRLGDGGYRLELRPEYDRLRQRVYGMGPREVKLSQDVLEVLAVIAYRQPVTPEELETCKPSSSGLLRQLIRRDLVQVQSAGRKRTDVTYQTTERFLSLFGLGSLDELPRAEDIEVK